MRTKQLSRVEIKNEDRGEVAAIFSTFDVLDHDGDVTRKGAFTDGAPVVISAYGHESWRGALPVGKGAIRELETEAVMEGRFFMDTTHGADTFRTVKALSDGDSLQEWSYSLENVKSHREDFEGRSARILTKIDVAEVSPVLKGAGIGTRTLATKGGLRFLEHGSSVLTDVSEFVDRARDVMALRAQKGKGLSDDASDLLEALEPVLGELQKLLDANGDDVETSTDDNPNDTGDTVADALVNEYLRFVAANQEG